MRFYVLRFYVLRFYALRSYGSLAKAFFGTLDLDKRFRIIIKCRQRFQGLELRGILLDFN